MTSTEESKTGDLLQTREVLSLLIEYVRETRGVLDTHRREQNGRPAPDQRNALSVDRVYERKPRLSGRPQKRAKWEICFRPEKCPLC